MREEVSVEVGLSKGLAQRLFLFAVVMDMLGRRAIQLGQRKAEYECVHERSSGPKTSYMGGENKKFIGVGEKDTQVRVSWRWIVLKEEIQRSKQTHLKDEIISIYYIL